MSTAQLNTRMTQDEYDKLCAVATAHGMSPAMWIRSLIKRHHAEMLAGTDLACTCLLCKNVRDGRAVVREVRRGS